MQYSYKPADRSSTVRNRTSSQSGSFGSSVPSVLYVVSVAFMFLLSRSVMSPLLLRIEAAFDATHAEAARIFVAYTIGYAASLPLSGFVSIRLVHRRLIPAAAAVGTIGLGMVSVSTSLAGAMAGLAALGVGFGMFVPSALSVITAAVERRDWQKAITLWELSPHLGMVFAPVLVLLLQRFLPWRGVYAILACLLLLSAALFVFRVRLGEFHGSGPLPSTILRLVRQPVFWLLMILFGVALAIVDGIYLLIPTYLIEEVGMKASAANSVFSVSRLTPIAALAAAAVIAHRLGPRKTVFLSLVGAGLCTVALGVSRGWLLMAAVFLQPSLGAIYFPAGFAMLSSLLPAESRNVAFSLVLPPAILVGTGLIPAFVAYLGDVVSFARGFVIVGIGIAAVGSTGLLLRPLIPSKDVST